MMEDLIKEESGGDSEIIVSLIAQIWFLRKEPCAGQHARDCLFFTFVDD